MGKSYSFSFLSSRKGKFLFFLFSVFLLIFGFATKAAAADAYAFYSDSKKTLTFYYDDQRDSRTGGTPYDLNTGKADPGWRISGDYATIQKVVFDKTFAKYYPSTCYEWFMFFVSLKTIENIENLNTSQVTNMNNMFVNCSGLETLDLSHFNTANVTDMGSMFSSCESLTTLDLSSFNTANVTDMGSMFSSCESLTTLDLSSFNTAKVESMNHMFSGCESLTTLYLSSFNTAKVKNMVYMFDRCANLKTIYVSDGWATTAVTQSNNMFRDCTNLKGGKGTKYADANPKDHTYAHRDGCTSDPGYLTYRSPYAVKDGNTLTFYCDDQRASRSGTTYDLNTDTDDPEWYNDQVGITTVIFNESFKDARPTTCYRWFYGFASLSTIEHLDYLNTSVVKDMGSMFYECTSLLEIHLNNFNTKNVTDMSYMFFGCHKITELDLSSFNTENVLNMDKMFNCHKLTTIYVNKWDKSKISNAPMFIDCDDLVGCNGTTFNTINNNPLYARIDDPDDGAPGYFTYKGPYAYLSNPGGTLTFYYDDQRYSNSRRVGTTYDLNTGTNKPDWIRGTGLYAYFTKVVFDETFANYYPTTCYMWFSWAHDLTTIENIEYLNTSNVTNMSKMFDNCQNLETLDLSHFNTDNVTDMSSMFVGCYKLETLDLSHFNTAKVRNMSYMFVGCNKLTTLDLSYFNTANVKDMSYMFHSCTNLTTLDISNFNTANVTSMSYMFQGCQSLTKLDLSNFNTAKVENMVYMFYGCANLETILVSDDWTTTHVTSHARMFDGCSKIKGGKGTTYNSSKTDKTYARIDDPDNGAPGYLTYKCPYAFVSSDEKTLTFYYDGQRDSRTGGTPYSINTGTENPNWRISGDYATIQKVVFDKTFASYYPTTCYMWFLDFTNLTTIENIENLNTSQVKDMSNMFAGCEKLETLDLSHFNTANVTNMEGMFGGCKKLKEVDLSKFNTANVTSMGDMFNGCETLTALDLSKFNTDNVWSMLLMFGECKNLTTLDLSKFNTAKVDDMRNMFYNCTNLETIYVSDGWNTDAVTRGVNDKAVFYNCLKLVGGKGTTYEEGLYDLNYAHVDGGTSNPGYLTYKSPYAIKSTDGKTLTFYCDDQRTSLFGTAYDLNTDQNDPAWLTAASTIETVAFDKSFATAYLSTCYKWFEGFSKLTTIKNIENLNTSQVTYMNNMFAGCTGLTTLDLSNFNTEEVTDMSNLFDGCTSLETIYVSSEWNTDAVTSASYNMFEKCSKLKGYLGTAYTSSNTGLTYAHVDGGTSNPGYLSFKPYVELSADGKTLTFYCDGDKASKAGDTYYVEYISYNNLSWSGKCDDVETVVFDASFDGYRPTRCNHWFSNFKKLKTITNLNYLHTDNVTNMQGMFEKCEALENLTLPETFKTDMVENMTWMFGGCENLETLSLPNSFNTGNVTLMMSMFNSCKKLTETTVDLSKLNTAKAENMREMFRDCEGFKELDFTKYPNFTTDNVYTMFYMFNGCCGLETLNISTFNTAKVQNMGGMFSGCSKIEELDLSNFDTNSLCDTPDKGLLGMFAGCKTLKTLDLRTFKTANIKQWQQVFNGCTNLSTILVSRINWSTNNCVYDNNMFDNCLNLIGNYGAMPKDEVGTGISEANWNENGYLTEGKYKIFYNGIDEDDNTFDTYTDAVTEYIDQAVTLTTPTKPGYIFDGWTRVYPDGTEETKVASVTISATDKGNRIYKANWVKAYTMRFETDGGTSVHADIVVAAGTDLSAEVNPIINKINTTSKLGYEFVSWDKDIPTTMPAEDVTITAQWKLVDYTITIDNDGGKLPEGKTNPTSYNIETPTFTLEKPEKTGYSFAGWYTGKGTDPDGVIAQGSYDNIAYTATWTPKQYTITFESDGGTDVSPITQDYNTTITPPADPTKEHYVFQGWYPALPATMPAKDMKLTAQWNDNRRTIVFDTNGGSEIASITQDIGTAITAPADPTREHYDFTGWDKVIPTTMPAENMTITAQWQIHSHKLTFDPANGTAATSATVAYGAAIATPAEPARTGYTFKGWDKTIPATMPDEDLTITAQWEVRKYTITFTDEDGNNLGSYTDEYGKPVPAPADPTREGYDFVGWDKEFPMPMPAEDVTVKATWKIHTHTITFDTKGGTTIAAITQDYGTAIAAPQNPEKEGHTFTAWDKTIPATMPDEDMTVTAQWKVNQYTLTFTDGDGNVIAAITDDFGAPITAPADPVRKGFTFLGWDKAIPATMPADEAELTITAQWRDDRQQIVVEVGSNFNFPNDAARYCDGTETSLAIDYKPVTGTATDYSLTFEGGALPSQSGQLTGGSITVEIPETTERGEFRGSLVFTGDADLTRPSETYIVTIKVDAPRKVAVQLYTDVLIADNHDNLYVAYQWLKDGNELTGETAQYYTSQSLGGTYVVRVTDRNGDTYNSCPLVIGAAQPTVSQSVKIYPNPTKAEERFTVEIDGYDESKSYNLLIYSNNGALVEQISGAQRQTSLTLPHGNYTGSVISEGQKSGFKLIVK